MNNDYCVYMHTFPNGKRYIGITCNTPQRRWQKGYGYARQKLIYNAICKYGWDNIVHEVIAEGLSLEDANSMEQKLIAKYKTTNKQYGYNIEVGGKACGHLTDEHKNKISIANSGANNGQYGRRYTEEERRQMSINSVWRGRKHSLESRKKMSEYAKAHPEIKSHKGKNHPMAKAVLQFDLNGNFIQRFETAAEASAKTGTTRSGICSCCKFRPKNKTAGGYVWRYADGNKPQVC